MFGSPQELFHKRYTGFHIFSRYIVQRIRSHVTGSVINIRLGGRGKIIALRVEHIAPGSTAVFTQVLPRIQKSALKTQRENHSDFRHVRHQGQVGVQSLRHESVIVAIASYIITDVFIRLSVRIGQAAGRRYHHFINSFVAIILPVYADGGIDCLYPVKIKHPFQSHP